MTRTAHRLHREPVVGEHEHAFAEVLPVPAGFPDRLAEELGGAHLLEAIGLGVTANQLLQRAQRAIAAWVPKHHAGGLLLEVKEVEAPANFSVIICSKHRRISVSVVAGTGGTTSCSRALPVLGGAGFVGVFSMSSYAQTKPLPPLRVVVVVVSASLASIEP